MAAETVLVYRIVRGDSTYPHSGRFQIELAGTITIGDSDGNDDTTFGDFTHTGGADVPDQDATELNVTEISVGDTVDLRYKYTFTGDDGSSGTIHFIATNGLANYGPLIVSDTPLDPSVIYQFGTFNTDGATDYDNLVPCFTTGTLIETVLGQVAVEALEPGDLVLTLDAGLQPIRWIGSKRLDAVDLTLHPNLLPIRIRCGALGPNLPERDLLVSPQHRILIRSKIAMRMFGVEELFLPANKLTRLDHIDPAPVPDSVTYHHLLFDTHQILRSNGAWTESLYTGTEALRSLPLASRSEIETLFPQIASGARSPQLARPQPATGKMMKRLADRHAKNRQPVQSAQTFFGLAQAGPVQAAAASA